MFDEYNSNNSVQNVNNVNIKPSCVGTLQKSHPKSYFEYCHVDSKFRNEKVDSNPCILQIMVFGDEHMVVEILPEEVYNELYNIDK